MFRGTNTKCKKCENTCKQFKQVLIVGCPNYISKKKKGRELKNGKN